MGADFIERTKRTFRKSWNRERVRLCTADLFTRMPESPARRAAADILNGCTLEKGTSVIIEREGKELVARQGNRIVANLKAPSAQIQEAITRSGGVANGSVEKVHPLSNVAEISLC